MSNQQTPNEGDAIFGLLDELAQEQQVEYGRVNNPHTKRTGKELVQAVFGMDGEKMVREYIIEVVKRERMEEIERGEQ